MKSFFSIIFVAFMLLLVACNRNNEELYPSISGNNKIVISAKSLGAITRSADTDPESTVAWLDVYVMDADKKIIYSERIDKSSAPVVGAGEFVLGKNRDEFTQDESYYVYMIANSTAPLATTSDVKAETWDDLKELTQTDRNLHLSGWGIENNDVKSPEYFLMDGFAYVPANVNDVGPAAMEALVINDGGDDNIELAGTLYRAAAKIVLNITQGDNVKFETVLDGATPLYSFYQLPISTLVVAPEADTRFVSEKQTTGEWGIDNKLFNFIQKDGKPMLTLLGYAYANDWDKEAVNESSLLLSIPMMWDKDGDKSTGVDGKEASSPVNWYKVPLSKNNKFERNTCYVINININAIGAEEKNTPIELKDVEYVTLPWQEVQVEIGQTIAKYLTLNTDVVKIYDKNFDLDQLTFTSSSPIKSIKLKDTFSHNLSNSTFAALPLENEITDDEEVDSYEARYTGGDGLYAYYIDKFGQMTQLGDKPGFDVKDIDNPERTPEEIHALESDLYKKDGLNASQQHIRAEVPADQKRALNGNIHIYSPINASTNTEDDVELRWNSHFNTLRYLEFEVMNEQGITATFRVVQYPLSVITNEEGFYSFRDDHVLTDDPNEKPFDLFNYDPNFNSVMTSSMYLCHPHDFTDEPRPSYEVWARTPEMHLVKPEDFKGEPNDAYWETVQQDRSYSWLKKDDHSYTWLFDPTNTCPSQGSEGETWVEIRYGFYANTITYNNGKNTKTFQGIHRPRIEDRPYSDYFYRDMYRSLPGELAITNSKYKGTGLGPYYKAEVIDKDGNKQTRIFRDHYRWNAQPVFWSKFVHKYYSEPAQGATYTYSTSSGTVYRSAFKQAGQVDMYEYGPSENGGKTWGRHTYSTNLYKFSNHRMYNIWTTATSSDYILGYPRYNEDGSTENSLYNSNVVSPSLTLASQLGETNYQQFLNNANYYNYIIPNIKEIYRVAERHCREYVETTFVDEPDANGVYNHMWDEGEKIIEYHDWRLPTKAEIDAIINFQNSSRAMDKVLDAQYYYCITGTADSDDLSNIHNWVSREIPDYDSSTSKGYYIRCVRDAGRKNK